MRRLSAADPVLVDVAPAGDVCRGSRRTSSSPPGAAALARYRGGQREAIIGGALFEGLAATAAEADREAGVGRHPRRRLLTTTAASARSPASTPRPCPFSWSRTAARATSPTATSTRARIARRLNYGVYDEGVHERLLHVRTWSPRRCWARPCAPAGGIELEPIMRRAVHMGDELHSRNAAATLLFARSCFALLRVARARARDGVGQPSEAFKGNDYFFLRLSMAARKATADAAHGIEGRASSRAMAFSCRGLRDPRLAASATSGSADRTPIVTAKLFDGHTEDEITWMGGECIITETVGLGGFAQAAALSAAALPGRLGRRHDRANNRDVYEICVGEHDRYQIPLFDYRGTPTGIDVLQVVETGTPPSWTSASPAATAGRSAPVSCEPI